MQRADPFNPQYRTTPGVSTGPGRKKLDSAHRGARKSHASKPPEYRKPTIAGTTGTPIDATASAGAGARIAPGRAK